MTTNDRPFNVSLSDDSMWQKLIAKRVVRKSEVTFKLLNGDQYSGWVTGLDEEWVQITDRNLEMHCLARANIADTGETGMKFYELDFTEEQRKKFDMFSNRFRIVCETELKRVGDSALYPKAS